MDETNELKSTEMSRRRALRVGVAGTLGVGVLSGTSGGSPPKANPIVVDDTGNADFSTISGAVDTAKPGDHVVVRPGNYSGDVVVDVEDLTLSGKGNAVVTGNGGGQAAVSVEADGVTIERLRVRNPGGLLGIKSQPGNTGVTIRNNRVSDVGPIGRLGVTGIISDANQHDLSIVGNRITGIRETTSGVAAQGILLDNEGGERIEGRVSNNRIHDVRSPKWGGIGITIQTAGAVVENNRIQGLRGNFAQGINYDKDAGETHLLLNTFEDISGSQYPGEGIKIDGGNPEGFDITRNNLLPPVGVNNATGNEVTAECNYWDSRSGPSPQGDGSAAVGPIDFTPWSIARIGAKGRGNTCRGGQ